LVVLAQNLNGYGNLCQFITAAARFGQRHLPPGLGCITGRSCRTVWCCCARSARPAMRSWRPWAAGR
jgi:hypothetical protein